MAGFNPQKRKRMEKLIYDFFTAIDSSGLNTKRYKEFFSAMTDSAFSTYFKLLFENEKAFLVLDIVDYEHTVTLEDIQRAAKVLGIPLFEYVYTPHLSMDKKEVIVTKEPVPVGYINIKRTQQTIAKKNGISTNIDSRSALTAQVTGADKNGRESDLENIMLQSMGLDHCLEELNGPRADDMVMKQQMLHDIALNGYTTLASLDNNINNKTTLRTVDTFLLGMGLKSDLVTKGLMLSKELNEELR